jgi:hypothetical protein
MILVLYDLECLAKCCYGVRDEGMVYIDIH